THSDGSIDEWGCFNHHVKETIARLKNWIDISKDEELDISAILRDFYQKFFEKQGKTWEAFSITSLNNQEYPTFDDLHAYLNSNQAIQTAPTTLARLTKLVLNVVTTKRKAFVGHTTMDGI